MAQLIAHRGLYKDNSIAGILAALEAGHGAEFDVRDGCRYRLSIHHDPEPPHTAEGFRQLINNMLPIHRERGMLAIDVKAAGLGEDFKIQFDAAPWLYERAFFFDLAGPDHIDYLNRGLPVYNRISDVEAPFFDERAQGLVWDHFGINDWMYENNAEVVTAMKREGKKIVQIGHDLWGRDWRESPLADYVITSRGL